LSLIRLKSWYYLGGIFMKKLVGLFSIGLLAFSLAACGTNHAATQNNSSIKAKVASSAEASAKAKSIAAHKTESSSAKAASESAEQSSFDATLASETAAAKSASTASSAAATEASSAPSETQASRPRSVIHGRDEAVAAAEAKYGNNGGDWVWGCLSSDDGSYFVKAISKSSTTMTKTAMSVIVYDDGSIVQQ
jgi:acyl-homoserine lactone acylase PvdQ